MAITDAINCDCTDETGYRTLAQLRAAVMAALGFFSVTSRTGTRTRAQLRQALKDGLGLADPITDADPRTLADLREQLFRALGFAAMGTNYPPGMADLLDDWINESQQTLWTRIELDNGGLNLPPRLVADTDLTTLDATPVLKLATALGKAHYAKPDAKAYFEQVEKYLADWAARNPPGLDALLNAHLTQAHDAAVRRMESINGAPITSTFAADSDIPAIDDYPIYMLAMASVQARNGAKDAGPLSEQVMGYFADLAQRTPPNAAGVVTAALKSAHALIHRRYDALRTERFFSWPLTAGVALYDFPSNAEVCTKRLDPYKITSVHVADVDGGRRKLTQGIPDRAFGYDTSGMPTHFEIRSCIHVWPAPEATEGHLVIRGHFAAEAFTADTDKPGVDDELVYLLALANAKAQYKQADAQLYMAQFESHLGKLIAGSHGTRRYVPGGHRDVDYTYTAPKPLVPFP